MRKTLGVVVGLAVLASAGGASAQVADLQLVSMRADVSHAKVGQQVTWTITARNNGPEPAEVDLNGQPLADFTLTGVVCSGITNDGPFCEWGEWIQGQLGALTLTATTTVNASAPRRASNTACVLSFGGPYDDPNPANDCLTKTLRIVGRR